VDDLISVIVSTYDREDALDVSLRALSRQSDRHFEIVVADDGSGPATAAVARAWAARAGVAVKHAWHEHRGFRLAEIRNRAILASVGTYLVFLDGDCIAPGDFVKKHRGLAEPGCFVTGTRVLLSRGLAERILRDGLEPETWPFGRWLVHRARGDVNRVAPIIHLPLGSLRRLNARRWQGARGSNMAFWRADIEQVDGFDAAFTGWGREDSDIFIRLLRAGVRRKDGRFAGTVLHLWHPDADRSRLADNNRQLEAALRSTAFKARQGLSEMAERGLATAADEPR
jgi:glycosyltransferase involved in cell wall biosynthesis